jgi:predicted nucleic acid-binding protein
MPINYNVQAEVIDLRSDTPQDNDMFLVDTNVWYWLTYTQASTSAVPYQIADYPSYIAKALTTKCLLSYCGLSLAELAHNIEQTERKIFNSRLSYDLKPKEYRHNYPTERANIVSEIEIAWSQVTSIAASTDITINEASTNAALNRFKTQILDGYDLMILEVMDKAGINQVITDDGDYVTVPRIKVFTANQKAIAAARSQGKLITR